VAVIDDDMAITTVVLGACVVLQIPGEPVAVAVGVGDAGGDGPTATRAQPEIIAAVDIAANRRRSYGELTQSITPLGYHTNFGYAASAQSGADFGLPTAAVGDSFVQADGSTLTLRDAFSYDAIGHLVSYTKGSSTSTLTYDGNVSTSLGRLASVTDPDGFTARTYYYTDGAISQTQTPFQSAVGLGVTRTYDPDGNETSETHHANCTSSNSCTPGVTQRWYDGADRLIEVSQPGNTGTGLPPVWLTRYKYDLSKGGQQQFAGSSFTAHGNLYATQEYTPGWQDISGISYDAVDRPLGKYKFSPGDSNPNAYVETMAYDGSGSAGLLSSVTNAVGERLNYAYDADGKVAAMTSSDNSLAALQYTYDPDGRAAAIASATYGSEARTYDDDGRETSVQEPSGNPHYTASSKIGYAYYPNGMRSTLSTTGRTFTQAPLLQYTYNGLGLLASETADVSNVPKKFSFAYTNAGRKSSETDPFTGLAVPGTSQHIVPTTWSYDPSEYGRVSAVQYPNGSLMQSISYDAEDSLRQWTIPNGSIQWAPINVSQSYSARSELTGQYFSSTSMPVHSGGTISNITFNGGTAPSLGGVRSYIDSRTGVVDYEQQSPPGCKYAK